MIKLLIKLIKEDRQKRRLEAYKKYYALEQRQNILGTNIKHRR